MINVLDQESRVCYDSHYRPWIKVECTGCKKIIWKEKRWTKKSDKLFCSKECFSLFRRDRIELTCAFCKKKIFKVDAHFKTNKTGLFFCNNACRTQASRAGVFYGTKIMQCCKCGDEVEVDNRASKVRCGKCRVHRTGKKRKIIDFYKVIRGEETTTSYTSLRLFLIKSGIKENKCEECGITEWQGKPLCVQLHHKDGDRKNNLLGNLKMFCPNCHTQTETWGVKNKKLKKRKRNTLDVAQLVEP